VADLKYGTMQLVSASASSLLRSRQWEHGNEMWIS